MTVRTQKYCRSLVNSYLKENETEPLIFDGWFTKKSKFFNPKTCSVESMVRKTLELTEEFESYTKDNDFYCRSSRNRSALDIWRHIVNFCPKVTIYEVMNALYNIGKEIRCQICGQIDKRVFYDQNFRGGKGYSGFVYHANEKDEFGLLWEEWSVV